MPEQSAADKVVQTEVKVCTDKTDHTCSSENSLSPAAREMAEELYENLAMGKDAYLAMLSRVGDSRIQTDMTAALCAYETWAGEVKTILQKADIEPPESGKMAKMSARAGITLNTLVDKTDSHIAEMLIEGCTMSVTTATKLLHHHKDDAACADLCRIAGEWAKFEEEHIETLKKHL